MKTYLFSSVLMVLTSLNACDNNVANENDMNSTHLSSTTNPLRVLEQFLANHSISEEATITRVEDLDLAGYSAFVWTPKSTGRAGQVFYLVKDEEVLSSGSNTLDIVMKQLIASNETLDVHQFATFFIRFKVVRYGVVLDTHDGHVLMGPNQLPEAEFSPPSRTETADGLNYSFWMFDTDRYVPVYYSISVSNDGTINYTTKELEQR
jgi:hypothetical protein